ncbi:hypothetical protein [Dyadobacter psychrotolerans]|uniref:DUF4332 domain-containing protein n=1 Tax=Dyadobacter psychrotolerans TaxID=2541721 RepID=A0A4R5DRS5_9BACT|nr:hypothetical protein [Dyadobacter psychrotolerans]TDE16397.1 hypothetical protein E0F88_09150 [Dyadobacter psychrotolerans]
MLLLQLSPYSKPVAITEIVIILAGAALLGYILARLIMNSRIRNLKEEVDQRKIELVECRALPEPVLAAKPVANKGALRTVYPVEEPNAGIRQDLKVIEGIGPKIEEILNKNGINNYSRLANMPPVRIAAILKGAGPRFQLHDPTTWPRQASLANEGKWKELEELKLILISGRQVD